jgi:hypothetical protein
MLVTQCSEYMTCHQLHTLKQLTLSEGVTEVVECLPSMLKALSSIPSTVKKQKQKKKKKESMLV